MMMPKQKPGNPAPPMAPSCAPVKPKSAAQLAKMPPRIPKPMPAARIAMKPAKRSRFALGAIAFPLLIGFGSWVLVVASEESAFSAAERKGLRFVTAARPVVKPNGAKHKQQDGRQDRDGAKGSLRGDPKHFIQFVASQRFEAGCAAGRFDLGVVENVSHPRQDKLDGQVAGG